MYFIEFLVKKSLQKLNILLLQIYYKNFIKNLKLK